MNQRTWPIIVAMALVFVAFFGCANTQRKPTPSEQVAVEPIRIPPPKQIRGVEISEIEAHLNRGKSKWVKVPRKALKEWIRLERQLTNDCRVVEEQLQAIKAIDTENWSDAKIKKADSSSR